MSLLRKVAQNTALQFIGKILGTLLGLGATILLLRYLGDERYGNYTTAIVYLQLFGILMDLGLYIVLLKHISGPENKDGKLLNNIITMRALTAVIFLVIACSLIWFIPTYPTIVKWAVMVVAVNFFFITMNQLLIAVYQKHLAMGLVAIAEVSGKTLLFLSTLVVIYVLKGDLLWVMLTVALGGFVNFLVLWLGLRKYTRIHAAFDLSMWKRVLKESWPVALSIGLNLIYFKADTIILSHCRTQAEVGIYGAPYKMLEVIITLPAMIVGLVMPMLGKTFNEQRADDFKQLYRRSFNALSMIAIPLIIGTQMVAFPVMRLIAGEEFTSNITDLGYLLQILIFAVGVIFVGTLTGYLVVIVNRQKEMLWGYGTVALTALFAYLYFIPKYGYYGAASVTVYSEFMITLIGIFIVYRATKVLPALWIPVRVLMASAIMATALFLLKDISVILSIPIAIVVYGVALILVRAVSREEVRSILTIRKNV